VEGLFHQPGRKNHRRKSKIMDYIIAGITSLGLFVYLLYALLRPEKF
jgi:K+-transporting ATPase KdpF subunit